LAGSVSSLYFLLYDPVSDELLRLCGSPPEEGDELERR
jgi:hypothetical protein